MSDTDHLASDHLASALHDRVQDERPDLDHLVAGATRAGTRLRRRRQIGVSLGAVAAVASVAVLGSQLIAGPGGTAGSGFATQPSASPPASSAGGSAATLDEQEARPGARKPRLRTLQELADARARVLDSPVRVALESWSCSDYLDEKLSCKRGPAHVTVTVRDASSHDDYRDPGKADVGPLHTFVSEVHEAHFATVMPGPGATQADLDAVGAALVWR